jgi:pimeloyl-ACP methyl ester carboxylesterase
LTRLSSFPVLRYFFYELFAGQLFVKMSNRSKNISGLTPPNDIPNFASRMRMLASHMKPPPLLAERINCPVFLIWGTRDRWYPPFVAKNIARQTKATIHWIDAGHYAMWEKPKEFENALLDISHRIESKENQ